MLPFYFVESTSQHLHHTWTWVTSLSSSTLKKLHCQVTSQSKSGLTITQLLEKHPTRAVEKAIKGMIPKNRLGKEMASKLKVYAGPNHPHAAQAPTPYVFDQVSQIVK